MAFTQRTKQLHNTTRYTYDGWCVLTETDEADAVQRDYVYGIENKDV